jgi:hypothetical protein
MTKLSQISEIRAGYTFRKPEKGTPTSSYPVAQIKDVTDEGMLDVTDLVMMQLPTVPERFILQSGDVLFCARGTRTQAAVFAGDVADVVAGTQFFVIEARRDRVLPEYLAWYINQRQSQEYLAACSHGSYVSMIHKEALMDLPVTLPSLETQHKILTVHKLALREQRLLEELKQRRADLVSALCSQAVEQFPERSKR